LNPYSGCIEIAFSGQQTDVRRGLHQFQGFFQQQNVTVLHPQPGIRVPGNNFEGGRVQFDEFLQLPFNSRITLLPDIDRDE